MKRINFYLFVTMAMLMLSVSSAWAQYVKVTDGETDSWIEIEGTINGSNIEISTGGSNSAIDRNTTGSIDLNEVWSRSGGRGTHYQVTSIGDYAFYYCRGLTSITIPSSVTYIGGGAFYNCSGLTSVTIPSSVASIGDSAFSGCSGLTSIDIPSSVTSIGNYAFCRCSGLTSIVVESDNSVYDSRNNCNAIIEKASNTLIAGCKNTKIPSSVTSIGYAAFYGCTGLTSIVIPSSVTSIGDWAFEGCSGLTSIVIPSSVTSIGDDAFYYCSGLTSITIPSSVTSIGGGAFVGCSGLTSIVIPSSVTSIGDYAFYYCSGLTSITIPSSVTSIGDYAFSYCSNLRDITSGITDVFETGQDAFSGCNNATLYVPKGLVDTYKSIADWNSISNIEEMVYKIPLTLACNSKGKVLVNGGVEFSNDVDHVDVIDGKDNTFEFIPDENCKLEQVIIDGFDVMSSVKDNKLTAKIRENSKMIVTFSKSSGDMNGDGMVNISDVVALVNLILAQ